MPKQVEYSHKEQRTVLPMADEFGSDFLTIVDEDGTEYELEVLSSLEYNGFTYLAVTPAGLDEEAEIEVSILKSVDEDGESILTAIEDEQELESVYSLIMDQLYEEDSDD
jgi:uncharacterized protein YrzB (UPF0473 family)